MGPDDELAIVRLNGENTRSTTSKEDALALIDHLEPSRPVFLGAGQIRALMDHAVDTIASLGHQMTPVQHRRKSIVCIGSSSIFNPTVPSDTRDHGSSYSQNWFEAIRDLSRANVSVYVIDPRGLPAAGGDMTAQAPSPSAPYVRSFPAPTSSDSARSFAEVTGGKAFVDSNLFDRAVDQIWREAGEYYLLGYSPPPPDGKLHRIDVKVKGRGVTLRHRQSRG